MKLGKLLFLVLGMTFLLPGDANAYIDPGSSAIVWQVLLAVFFGICFYVKKIRYWITGGLKKIKDKVKGKPS
jgi:hypothetical protein